jgi:hypothetical protein
VSGCYSARPQLLLIYMNKTRPCIILGLFESIVWRCSNVQRGSFRQHVRWFSRCLLVGVFVASFGLYVRVFACCA